MGLACTVRARTKQILPLGSDEGARPSHPMRRFPTDVSPVNNRGQGHCGP